MEPGHEDREYAHRHAVLPGRLLASMEPGHEDREYSLGVSVTVTPDTPQWSPVMKTGNTIRLVFQANISTTPQWSPVMKTGNTGRGTVEIGHGLPASMEPGHEDREYVPVVPW